MKINRNTVIWGVFAALQLVSTYSSALTLGRVRGAVLLGKELDLSVLVQFAADEDMSGTCFDADLSFGDTPLERGRYTVTAQPGSQANTQLVRVQSSARVDDALVSLNLRAACGPLASRRYVLLPDVVSELAGAGSTFPGAIPAGNNVAREATASKTDWQLQTAAGAGNGVVPAKPVASTAKPAGKPAPVITRKKPAAVEPASTAVDSGTSRVQVSAAALEDLHKRVDEIAKWQASNSDADEQLKSAERAKSLEEGIRNLQMVTAKNQANLQIVAAAVEGSTAQSYGRTLVYLMGALLLACLAALAYVLMRLRSGGFDAAPWWSAGEERAHNAAVADNALMPSEAKAAPSFATPQPASVASAKPIAAPFVTAAQAPQSVHDADSGFGPYATVITENLRPPVPQPVTPVAPAAKPARPDFVPSGHGTLRAVNTREMLDVRQQADFFMALGQHDEAVRMLESSIRGSADANPLVYLDLLKILHTLSRRSDFERYREDFNFQFTGRIPSYSEFLVEGNGLEAYEDICQQIIVLWPTEYTIDFIEQCLVRTPEDDPEQGMDLEAFKDLLLLYGVLKRLDQFYDSSLAPFSASRPAHAHAGSAHAVLEPSPSATLAN